MPVVNGGMPLPVKDYGYDEEGNRTASHLSALYSSNAHNQLEEDDSYSYAYDARGNRTSRTSKATGAVETYSYDSQNRLIGYTDGTTVASYAYDALDRRIAKVVDGVTVAKIHDSMDFSDPTTGTTPVEFKDGSLFRRWVFGSKTDEPMAFEEYAGSASAGSGSTYSLYANRIGSIVTAVSLATGTAAAEYDYSAFGDRIEVGITIDQQYGFVGREHDAETGTIQMRMRDYDPSSGLFLQQDPAGLGGDGPNLYTYALSDPVNNSDPTGLVSTATYFSPNAQDARKQMVGGVTSIVSEALLRSSINIAERMLHSLDPVEIGGLAPPNGGGSDHCNAKSNQTGNHVYMIYNRKSGKIMKFGIGNNKLLYAGNRRSKRADSQVDNVVYGYIVLIVTPDGFFSRGVALAIEAALVKTYGAGPWQDRPTANSKCPMRG